MDRQTLTVLAVVVLGVVALGLSAATLTTPEEAPGESRQSPESNNSPGDTRPETGGE